jgi:hypothetical protein
VIDQSVAVLSLLNSRKKKIDTHTRCSAEKFHAGLRFGLFAVVAAKVILDFDLNFISFPASENFKCTAS